MKRKPLMIPPQPQFSESFLREARADHRRPDPKPFLKWVGGKRQLLPELVKYVPEKFGTYYEPFLGGGALFFALRCNRMFPAVLGDANERLVRTYLGVRNDVEAVINGLKACRYERAEYYETRAIHIDAPNRSNADVAVWLIYLNRCGFNGLYRVNRVGMFNVPIGRYDNPVICDVEGLWAASSALRKTTFKIGDFEKTVKSAERGDLVYFDPPYVPAGTTSNFTAYTTDGFSSGDQTRLRNCALKLKQRGVHVILSNSDTKATRQLYRTAYFELHPVQARRAINSKASKRGAVRELIIT